MRPAFYPLLLLTAILIASSFSFALNPSLLINRIEGRVYDENRNPVPDADVELYNEVDSFLAHTKTTTVGRFSFAGVPSGVYRIRVIALRTNLLEQTQDVQISNLRPGGSDTAYIDFYLRYDKRRSGTTMSSPDAIFVQEVPTEAKRLFESATGDFEKSPEKAFTELEKAINIFPNYFDALSLIGKEYINRKQYEKGYPYLLRAIDINQRSPSAYYSLGYAFLQLNQLPAAVKAAKAVVILTPESVDSQLLYGTVLRINGNYAEAEKVLLKAKSLAKKPVAEIHWQLALLYNRLNRNKEASDELETYLKLEPDSPNRKKVEELIAKLRKTQ